jgi:drug/metabolite transporter (DMT)-like permease
MVGYLGNTMVTSIIWGCMGIMSGAMGFSIAEGGAFLKALFYGLSTIPFFFLYKKEINKDVLFMVKNKPRLLAIAIVMFLLSGSVAQYNYFKAIKLSNKHAHIVITITHTLPIVLTVIGSYFLLGEEINKETIIGIIFVLIGVVIMKMFGHKSDNNKN